MTVARDAVLEFATFTTTSPATLSFTPVGTPRGVSVWICLNGGFGDTITGVTYGGVPMARIGISDDQVSEQGIIHCYFLGAGIPTGTQTVSIAHTGDALTKWAVVQSVTAAGDTEAANFGALHDWGFTNPSFPLNTGAVSALRTGIVFSGHDDLGSLAPLAGMEAIAAGNSHDFGTAVTALGQQTTASTGAFTIGFTAALEDAAFIAIAIQEIQTDAFPYTDAAGLFWWDITAATSHLIRLPDFVAAGDLLLVGFAANTVTVATPTDWTLLNTATGGSLNMRTYYKIADGTEGGTLIDFVTSATARATAYVQHVTDWHGTTPPEVGTAAQASSTLPNPPSLTPSWGAEDTLWLVAIANSSFVSASSYSANYDYGIYAYTTGAGPTTSHILRRKLNTATEDPGTTTLTASVQWVAQTIAIRPAVAPAVPTAPTNLVATAVSATQINLAWDDNSSDETSFRVERSPDGAGSWVTVGTPAADSTTFSNTGLTCETEYFYRVFAVNGVGDSTASNTDSAITSTCPPPSNGGNRMGGTGAIRRPPRTYLNR